MTNNDITANWPEIPEKVLKRLCRDLVDYAHDVIPGETEEGDQFVEDVKVFYEWIHCDDKIEI